MEKHNMWILYGDGRFGEKKVAAFSSEEKAQEYIERSRLKYPGQHIFRAKSLLRAYYVAWIDYEDELPYDPDLLE